MTNQETFNKVYNHLKKQNTPAITPLGACRYRTEDGRMCAVGCLIPDEDYQGDFEGSSLVGIINMGWDPEEYDLGLLAKLQIAHDNWFKKGGEWFWASMESVAKEFNLEVPEK